MSGIFGYKLDTCSKGADKLLEHMSSALPKHDVVTQLRWTDDEFSVGVGTLHPKRLGGPEHLARDSSTGVCCIVDGVVFSETGSEEEKTAPAGAALLLERYLDSGIECLSELGGSFNVAWWDGRSEELIVACDKLGQRLMYYTCRSGNIVFGSALAHLMATDIPKREIDLEGFVDLIHYGYILGERTLFKEVHTLPPGGALIYKRGELNVHQYWRLNNIESRGRYDERCLDNLERLFKLAVRRSVRQDMTCAVDLTGGLDSRCIFAAAAHEGLSFVAHTGGQEDSTDVVLAKQVAELEGVPHIFEHIGPDRLDEWLVPMVLHQGGMVATLHSHPCQHFDASFSFDAVIQGIGATYARGHWVTPEVLEMRDMDSIQAYMNRVILNQTGKRLTVDELWQPAVRPTVAHGLASHLPALINDYHSSDSAVAVIDYLAYRERFRKFLNKAIVIVRNSRDAYFPYLDHPFMEALAALPIGERVKNRILVDLVKRWNPKLLDIAYEKNLMPLSASNLQMTGIRLGRAARRRLARRLSFVRPVVEKVPNHFYSEWTRNELRPAIEELVCNPDAAFRAYLRWETVDTAIKEHLAGEANWENLLGALVVFEIAHRLWIEPRTAGSYGSSGRSENEG